MAEFVMVDGLLEWETSHTLVHCCTYIFLIIWQGLFTARSQILERLLSELCPGLCLGLYGKSTGWILMTFRTLFTGMV